MNQKGISRCFKKGCNQKTTQEELWRQRYCKDHFSQLAFIISDFDNKKDTK